ncbi:hypothetical protein MNBD_CHLOROFLEXI01-1588 [hydrothermal vent metagenome]|uniref:Effector-associated domain-containing protein n=1 Tax=hydrothermal vent metagenome TaxID=652676 RepID=A0A3B0V9F6_9ZZZZ
MNQEYNEAGQLVKELVFNGTLQDFMNVCISFSVGLNQRFKDVPYQFVPTPRKLSEDAKTLLVVFTPDLKTGIGGEITATPWLGNKSLLKMTAYPQNWPKLEHLWTLFVDELKRRDLIEDDKGQHIVMESDTVVSKKPQPTSPTTLTLPQVGELGKLISKWFSKDELRNLSLYLSLDYENLPSDTKDNLARELVNQARRENKVPKLWEKLYEERPHVDWSQALILQVEQ